MNGGVRAGLREQVAERTQIVLGAILDWRQHESVEVEIVDIASVGGTIRFPLRKRLPGHVIWPVLVGAAVSRRNLLRNLLG